MTVDGYLAGPRFVYVCRPTESGTTVYDVIWTGRGLGDAFYPRHVCTTFSRDEATKIVEALGVSRAQED